MSFVFYDNKSDIYKAKRRNKRLHSVCILFFFLFLLILQHFSDILDSALVLLLQLICDFLVFLHSSVSIFHIL